MASNKANITNIQEKGELSLVKDVLKILAIGIAGGAALLSSAKALGDKMDEKNVDEKFK